MTRGNSPEDPAEQSAVPRNRPVGGNDDRDTGLDKHLNETRTDSETGEGEARRRTDDARASHRPGVASRGASAHAEGWRTWYRRGKRNAVRTGPGAQPPAPGRAREVRCVLRTTR